MISILGVPLSICLGFERVIALSEDPNMIIVALKQSEKLELNPDNSMVRRKIPYDPTKDKRAKKQLLLPAKPDLR
jgi:hypothetical protein